MLEARSRFQPAHRVLSEPEAVAVLADYEQRNQWAVPLVRRVLSRLVGGTTTAQMMRGAASYPWSLSDRWDRGDLTSRT